MRINIRKVCCVVGEKFLGEVFERCSAWAHTPPVFRNSNLPCGCTKGKVPCKPPITVRDSRDKENNSPLVTSKFYYRDARAKDIATGDVMSL